MHYANVTRVLNVVSGGTFRVQFKRTPFIGRENGLSVIVLTQWAGNEGLYLKEYTAEFSVVRVEADTAVIEGAYCLHSSQEAVTGGAK
ncbi:hypothetical protein, partial [Ralstonia solanacearum]|uniref:hypothetical protein n=1 Tax=Ralstonia solanacearum TaxID=305 RepID=UPI0019D38066